MRITSQTQYAIRMLMYCANKEGLSTTLDIAKFYNLPESFMLKVMHSLRKAELLEAVRGRGGGIRLAMPADKIMLGDVIKLIENDFDLAECFSSAESVCPLTGSCGLNSALSRALNAFFEILNEYSIQDLVKNEHNIGVLMRLDEAMKQPLEPATN